MDVIMNILGAAKELRPGKTYLFVLNETLMDAHMVDQFVATLRNVNIGAVFLYTTDIHNAIRVIEPESLT